MHDLCVAVLTISDSRALADDKSGDLLANFIAADQHQLVDRALVRDDIYAIRAQVSQWIADAEVQVVITTGGTGFTGRDSTPEALLPLIQVCGLRFLFLLVGRMPIFYQSFALLQKVRQLALYGKSLSVRRPFLQIWIHHSRAH